jgi:hypothetical protein
MVLPEHVECYLDQRKERYQPPVLDEQRTEELNRVVQEARAEDRPLRWTAYNEEGPYVVEGKVGRVHPMQGWVEVLTLEGKVRLPIVRLLDVEKLG